MNRLADSLSPYLLQHQHNPVDWFPWCDQAFELAKQTDRPIFLSVGYAACHWCHVMEHESFESEAIAKLLNDNFVSIKVDREERPDIDQIYMNAVQVMAGRGGWPMSVFLNHQRQPFYAGTYWPPTQRMGMPGFVEVLDAITDAWNNRRVEVEKHAGEITQVLGQLAVGTSQSGSEVPPDDTVTTATDQLMQVLDRQQGGFGAAPKFPHATDLELLLRRGLSGDAPELVQAVEFTLDKMAGGGIRDHLGGGFARYSVDAKWLVPHFEKMLYDNALLAEVYVRGYQVTGNQRHADVAGEVFDYLCREMVDAAGGFHCSEDADSEGVEGKFYVWTPQQIHAVLGDQRGQRFCQIYDVTDEGNFEGENILNLPRDLADWAQQLSIPLRELRAELADDRSQLLAAREQRVRPGRDDKVLTAWNSLAIKALAIGGGVLDRPQFVDAAVRAAEFTRRHMRSSDGRLKHAFRDGKSHLAGYIDDYAYTVEAAVALFEATAEPQWIEWAIELADHMLTHFEDPAGGFFYTADDAETLITCTKDWHDGSLVSGNASAAMGLLKLSRLCHRDDYRQAAERVFQAASEVLQKQGSACAALLAALDRYWHDDQQWVLAVPDDQSWTKLRPLLLKSFRPHVTISVIIGDAPSDSGPIVLNHHRGSRGREPALYRCRNYSCDQPLIGDAAVELLR